MGADLFESYVGSILGTMVLGAAFYNVEAFADCKLAAVVLPLVLAGIGIVTSIGGTFLVKVKEGGSPHKALNLGEIVSAVALLALTYLVIIFMLPSSWEFTTLGDTRTITANGVFFAILFGLGAGLGIGKITEFYTGCLLYTSPSPRDS